MQVVLQIQTGALAGNEIRLKSGQLVRLGRTSKADFAFPDDSQMSGVHFALECDQQTCRLRDLGSSNGTLINGEKAQAVVLQDRDQIVAGQTRFSVRLEADEPKTPTPLLEEPTVTSTPSQAPKPEERLLAMLRNDFQPLYAILDAAASPNVYKLLYESKQESEKPRNGQNSDAAIQPGNRKASAASGSEARYESLYEGKPKAELTMFAPYLVRLPPESKLLEKLVNKGWGKSWGVYLTCNLPFSELRNHLRHFLMARMPDGTQVYFRFYDPRVLRVYLPTCLPEEINQFFGPVRYYLTEDEKREAVLRFSNAVRGVGRKLLQLSPN
jgi:pSer/pThr/pTyr-binding forkhead associated (FHA) protein